MTTIILATIQDYVILINKYCTCSEGDIFPSNHQDGCGYKQWYDEWEGEYLSERTWLEDEEKMRKENEIQKSSAKVS